MDEPFNRILKDVGSILEDVYGEKRTFTIVITDPKNPAVVTFVTNLAVGVAMEYLEFVATKMNPAKNFPATIGEA